VDTEIKNLKPKKETILVTGASGHIGLNLCKIISEKKFFNLISICRNKNKYLEKYSDRIINLDVTKYDDFLNACSNIDYVIHLATVHEKEIETSIDKVKIIYETSVKGTENLIRIAKVKNFKKIIFASSVAICGVTYDKKLLNENDNFKDVFSEEDPYIKAKNVSHKIVEKAITEGLPFVIMMPSSAIGINDFKLSPPNRIIKKLMNFPTNLFYLRGGINLINVKDLAFMFYHSIKNSDIGEKYILSGYNIEIKDLILKINSIAKNSTKRQKLLFLIPKIFLFFIYYTFNPVLKILGKKFPISLFQIKHRVNTYAFFDNSKIKKKWGLHLISLDQTLKETTDWINNYFK